MKTSRLIEDDNEDEMLFAEAQRYFSQARPCYTSSSSSSSTLQVIDTVSKYCTPKKPRLLPPPPPPSIKSVDTSLPHKVSTLQHQLLPVTKLPSDFSLTYSFSHFNRLQSACFTDLYESDVNLVISAPTASGKTALMEIALARMFKDSSTKRSLYLAPLKALCTEKATEWQFKYKSKLHCEAVVGITDSPNTTAEPSLKSQLDSSHVVCATPEKWVSVQSMVEMPQVHKFVQNIGLVLIDECHMVGTDRGASLELAIAMIRANNSNVRIIATSATIGNIRDMAKWLSNQNGTPAKTMTFGEEYRPVPLSKIVLGYNCNDTYFKFQRNLDFKLPSIINSHGPGQSTIVFCPTRGSAQETCRYLSRNISRLKSPPSPIHLTSKFTNNLLNETVSAGVAYHHAGLSASDRARVEQLFQSRSIQILCSTSTLGIGINLPAYMVIVKGTKGYTDNDYTEYTKSEIMQFIGRAGRPQFGASGKAVILTANVMTQQYQNLVSGNEVLESSLGTKISQAILGCIYRKELMTQAEIVDWLRKTFLAVRLEANVSHYIDSGGISRLQQIGDNDYCKFIVSQEISRLCNAGLLEMADGTECLTLTTVGECVAKHKVEPLLMASVMKSLPLEPSYQQLLEIISRSGIFADFKIITGQKGVLNDLNKDPQIQHKLAGRVQTIDEKVFLLLQYKLTCQPLPLGKFSSGLGHDMNRIIQLSYGPALCIREGYVERGDVIGTLVTSRLCCEIAAKCSNNTQALLQQIEGIGMRYSQLLWEKGIRSIAQLVNTSARQIESLTNRNPPFGAKTLLAASSLPICSATVSEYWLDQCSIVFTVSISCNAKPKNQNNMAKFSIVVYTSDQVLLSFKTVELSIQGAYYELQAGLCNPTPGSSICVHISPEAFVGCDFYLEKPIPVETPDDSSSMLDNCTDLLDEALLNTSDDLCIDLTCSPEEC